MGKSLQHEKNKNQFNMGAILKNCLLEMEEVAFTKKVSKSDVRMKGSSKKKKNVSHPNVFCTSEITILHGFFSNTAQEMKFPIKDFFGKCDQIHRKRIWSHLIYCRFP